jgi:Schlafen, AlbA_2
MKEAFARFFESPSREAFRELMKNQTGEAKHVDFKEMWPKWTSLAKHILGAANSGSAILVCGVKESTDKSLESVGLVKITDKADILNGIKKYIPSSVLNKIEIHDFSFQAAEYPPIVGKTFQVLVVNYDIAATPAIAAANGEGITAGEIYVRREGQTERAVHEEVQEIINKRIESGYSSRGELDLQRCLEHLKLLMASRPNRPLWPGIEFRQILGITDEDTFGDFIDDMVEQTKSLIAKTIGATYRAKASSHARATISPKR